MKKTIAIDMDEVISQYYKKVLSVLKSETGFTIDPEKITGKLLSQALDPYFIDIVSSYPYRKGFFRDLDVVPGSQEVIQSLMDIYDIIIVSACMQHTNSLADKLEWLNVNFPFIKYQKIIFCGEKINIRADYMIDDLPKNLETFRGTPLLFTSFHNRNENRFLRFDNWQQIKAFFLKSQA
jgi:5'-nucleotidase